MTLFKSCMSSLCPPFREVVLRPIFTHGGVIFLRCCRGGYASLCIVCSVAAIVLSEVPRGTVISAQAAVPYTPLPDGTGPYGPADAEVLEYDITPDWTEDFYTEEGYTSDSAGQEIDPLFLENRLNRGEYSFGVPRRKIKLPAANGLLMSPALTHAQRKTQRPIAHKHQKSTRRFKTLKGRSRPPTKTNTVVSLIRVSASVLLMATLFSLFYLDITSVLPRAKRARLSVLENEVQEGSKTAESRVADSLVMTAQTKESRPLGRKGIAWTAVAVLTGLVAVALCTFLIWEDFFLPVAIAEQAGTESDAATTLDSIHEVVGVSEGVDHAQTELPAELAELDRSEDQPPHASILSTTTPEKSVNYEQNLAKWVSGIRQHTHHLNELSSVGKDSLEEYAVTEARKPKPPPTVLQAMQAAVGTAWNTASSREVQEQEHEALMQKCQKLAQHINKTSQGIKTTTYTLGERLQEERKLMPEATYWKLWDIVGTAEDKRAEIVDVVGLRDMIAVENPLVTPSSLELLYGRMKLELRQLHVVKSALEYVRAQLDARPHPPGA